jgi:hypothetical protein
MVKVGANYLKAWENCKGAMTEELLAVKNSDHSQYSETEWNNYFVDAVTLYWGDESSPHHTCDAFARALLLGDWK